MTLQARFASSTAVPVDRSRAELERLLRRYGADQFVSGWESGRAMVGFTIEGRSVRLEVPLPSEADLSTKHRPSGSRALENAIAQVERQRWRALLLLVKAKLEAIALGIETLETAFLADIVVRGGKTVGELLRPQLTEIAEGCVPRLLPPKGGR